LWPDESNTGIVKGSVLSPVHGDLNITKPGLYEAKHVNGTVWVKADNHQSQL
jgi:hypothetical protein